MSIVWIYSPSRRIVALSQIWKISSNLWLTYNIVTPCFLSFLTTSNKASVSFVVSEAVGSSRDIIVEWWYNALAIANICISPAVNVATKSDDLKLQFKSSNITSTSLFIFLKSIKIPFLGSYPIVTFCPTVRSFTTNVSWWTLDILPFTIASFVSLKLTFLPWSLTSPSYSG